MICLHHKADYPPKQLNLRHYKLVDDVIATFKQSLTLSYNYNLKNVSQNVIRVLPVVKNITNFCHL